MLPKMPLWIMEVKFNVKIAHINKLHCNCTSANSNPVVLEVNRKNHQDVERQQFCKHVKFSKT